MAERRLKMMMTLPQALRQKNFCDLLDTTQDILWAISSFRQRFWLSYIFRLSSVLLLFYVPIEIGILVITAWKKSTYTRNKDLKTKTCLISRGFKRLSTTTPPFSSEETNNIRASAYYLLPRKDNSGSQPRDQCTSPSPQPWVPPQWACSLINPLLAKIIRRFFKRSTNSFLKNVFHHKKRWEVDALLGLL